jgi:hypothetical protein
MNWYKKSQLSKLDDLMQEALRFDNPEDFSRAYSVKHNLTENNININSDGTVTLYHSTSPEIAEKIMSDGYIKGGSTATGGMTGLALKPSAFFGWDRDWVERTWGRSKAGLVTVNVPYWYIRQPAQNEKEVYFEEGLKRVDDDKNIWEPVVKPRDTFYSRVPSKDYDFQNEETLEKIWEMAHKESSHELV